MDERIQHGPHDKCETDGVHVHAEDFGVSANNDGATNAKGIIAAQLALTGKLAKTTVVLPIGVIAVDYRKEEE